MSFQGKYHVLSALGTGETQLFRATQISSGRQVLIHHLSSRTPSPSQPELALLVFKFLVSGLAEKTQELVDMGEDEGRIFVVMADVPACLDLREWLLSKSDPQAGVGADVPPVEGTLGLGSFLATRSYTTEALRQVSEALSGPPAAASTAPSAAPPAVPAAQKSPSAPISVPRIPPASFKAPESGPTDFVGIWEKSSLGSFAGQPATFPPSTNSKKSPDTLSEAPEVTAEFLSKRGSSGVHDSPTATMTTLQALAADHQPAPHAGVAPAGGKDNAGGFADVILDSPASKKPTQDVGDVTLLAPQPGVTPPPNFAETRTPVLIKDLLGEYAQSAPPVAVPPPSVEAANGAEELSPAPRRPIPMGFELVFQSNKPRSRPTLSGAPDQSGILSAATIMAPRSGPEVPPAPLKPTVPEVAPRAALSPPAAKTEGSPDAVLPQALGITRPAIGASREPAVPPSPPKTLPEPERPPWLVSTPSAPPAKADPPAPVVSAVPPPPAAPRVPPALPPPNRTAPGEFTRMMENIKAAAGPLPPVASPGISPGGARPTATPVASPPTPSQSSYLRMSAQQPTSYHKAPQQFKASTYVANDTPLHSGNRKRKVWVPILILSSLFLMTVGVLLFFALKR